MKMKNLLLGFAFLITSGIAAQTARVQIIHNAPDPAADTVNVYANNNPLLTDFAFREATPFIDVTANANITISVMPKGVTDTSQAVYSTVLNLTNNETYVAIASGVLDTTGPAVNEPFSIELFAGAQESANMSLNTDILVHHGSPDAPPVDVVEVGVGVGTAIDNLAYPSFRGYAPFINQDYVLQIKDSTQSVDVREYDAPISTLGWADSAVVILASGFYDNISNPGPSFAVLAVLPNGQVISLPETTAKVQMIHNVADPAASTVDVWFNSNLQVPNVSFRTASQYLDFPANSDITVSITPPNSSDTSGALIQETFNLMRDSSYVAVASGVRNNPMFDSIKPLELNATSARTEAQMMGNTDVLVYHGATDAGAVTVNETTVPVPGLVTNLGYGEFSSYLALTTADYNVEVTSASSGNVVARYGAPLSNLNLNDSSIVVVASGFLDTTKGAKFGLYAALPTGGPLVQLPVSSGIGLDENPQEGFAVYPTPAEKLVNVELNGIGNASGEVKIIDLTGATVDQRTVEAGEQNLQFDVSELNSGIYLIQYKGADNKRHTKRIQVL